MIFVVASKVLCDAPVSHLAMGGASSLRNDLNPLSRSADSPAMGSGMRAALVLLLILLVATVFFALLYRPPDGGDLPELSRAYFEVRCSTEGVAPNHLIAEEGAFILINVTSLDNDYVFHLLGYAGITQRVPGGETVALPPFQATVATTLVYTCSTGSTVPLSHRGVLEITASAEESPDGIPDPTGGPQNSPQRRQMPVALHVGQSDRSRNA